MCKLSNKFLQLFTCEWKKSDYTVFFFFFFKSRFMETFIYIYVVFRKKIMSSWKIIRIIIILKWAYRKQFLTLYFEQYDFWCGCSRGTKVFPPLWFTLQHMSNSKSQCEGQLWKNELFDFFHFYNFFTYQRKTAGISFVITLFRNYTFTVTSFSRSV